MATTGEVIRVFAKSCRVFREFMLRSIHRSMKQEEVYTKLQDEVARIIADTTPETLGDLGNVTELMWSAAFRAAVDLRDVRLIGIIVRHQRELDVNMLNDKKTPALVYAELEDNSTVRLLLLRAGANPLIPGKDGWNTVRIATKYRRVEALQLYLEEQSDKFSPVEFEGFNAINLALSFGQSWMYARAITNEFNLRPMDHWRNSICQLAMFDNDSNLLLLMIKQNCCRFGDEVPLWKFAKEYQAEFQSEVFPTFEFILASGRVRLARFLFEAGETGKKLTLKYCPVERKYFSFTLNRFVDYPIFGEDDDDESATWLKHALSTTPNSLLALARHRIRAHWRVKLESAVENMHLPRELKSYVLMKDEIPQFSKGLSYTTDLPSVNYVYAEGVWKHLLPS